MTSQFFRWTDHEIKNQRITAHGRTDMEVEIVLRIALVHFFDYVMLKTDLEVRLEFYCQQICKQQA